MSHKGKNFRVSEWFIEPAGNAAAANEAIARYFDNDEARMATIAVRRGPPRKLWQCTLAEARALHASRRTLGDGIEFNLCRVIDRVVVVKNSELTPHHHRKHDHRPTMAA